MKAIAVFLLLISATTAGAADVKWSTSPFANSCKDLQAGDPDKGEDYILKACDGPTGVSSYILYNEGTRMSVGFGSSPMLRSVTWNQSGRAILRFNGEVPMAPRPLLPSRGFGP